MTVALSQQERTRLAKLLGLLGSNHSGERDAAGLAAHRLVMNAGATWFDVLTPQGEHHRRKPEPEPERDDPEPDWPPAATNERVRVLAADRRVTAQQDGAADGLGSRVPA
jgi:hypothetical protein